MHANPHCTFVLAALLAVSATSSGSAQQNTSAYTSVAFKGCQKFDVAKVEDNEIGASFECKGLPGYSVVVTEDDLRMTVAVGLNRKDAQDQPSFAQGFSPFNSVHDTLEWRIDAKTKNPLATIQRWFIADSANPTKDGTPPSFGLLVVTRTPPGPSCHVAYIDVRANKDANLLARKAADELAEKFDCAKDKVRFIGNRGRAAELAGDR